MKRIAPFVFIAFAAIALAGTVVWDRTYDGAQADGANSMVPNPGQIIVSFPICSFRSSWGPRCPDSEAEKTAVRLFTGGSIEKIGLNADNAFIETDNWYYSINSVKENDLGFTFDFVDKAKFGTYSQAKKFYVERDKVSLGWVIVGRELTYKSGPDQQNIGKYLSFDIPVPLRVDE
jgi:hypothetical protein